ncbi:hypothetical protein [Xenorhabdus bovienii]|uniref:hypothetical protein n=1 Tax=Xenorhabdus bovienii TaxID=40576 RepID=UPI0004D4716A|nr:hypothetical protein [Xenorhabdus bovienii]CDG86543.1 conserved hypothetical protein [Xenorhabdus bovienii str. feltiae France]CDG94212.1 conserved hypothetical protein [Xenorhabdus bovienii str. feltiae Florida]
MKAQNLNVKLYVYAQQSFFNETSILVTTTHPKYNGDLFGVLVATHEIELPYPSMTQSDLVNAQINSLRTQQKKVIADAQVKASELEDQIQALLCIEGQPISKADEEIPY